MEKVNEKSITILCALTDAYRDEEDRESDAFAVMELSEDVTEDFTAMLLAMKEMFDSVVGGDIDLIDFTHILNKLAVQYIMENGGAVSD